MDVDQSSKIRRTRPPKRAWHTWNKQKNEHFYFIFSNNYSWSIIIIIERVHTHGGYVLSFVYMCVWCFYCPAQNSVLSIHRAKVDRQGLQLQQCVRGTRRNGNWLPCRTGCFASIKGRHFGGHCHTCEQRQQRQVDAPNVSRRGKTNNGNTNQQEQWQPTNQWKCRWKMACVQLRLRYRSGSDGIGARRFGWLATYI